MIMFAQYEILTPAGLEKKTKILFHINHPQKLLHYWEKSSEREFK